MRQTCIDAPPAQPAALTDLLGLQSQQRPGSGAHHTPGSRWPQHASPCRSLARSGMRPWPGRAPEGIQRARAAQDRHSRHDMTGSVACIPSLPSGECCQQRAAGWSAPGQMGSPRCLVSSPAHWPHERPQVADQAGFAHARWSWANCTGWQRPDPALGLPHALQTCTRIYSCYHRYCTLSLSKCTPGTRCLVARHGTAPGGAQKPEVSSECLAPGAEQQT